MPYTIPRGQKRDSQFYQSFNGLVGECFESIAKLAVCWQFCGQLAPGISQHTYAKAYKLEPVVGLGLVACPSCSSRQLCRLRNLHQFALNSCDITGKSGGVSSHAPAKSRTNGRVTILISMMRNSSSKRMS